MLSLSSTRPGSGRDSSNPYGCYYMPSYGSVYFNQYGNRNDYDTNRVSICSKSPLPHDTSKLAICVMSFAVSNPVVLVRTAARHQTTGDQAAPLHLVALPTPSLPLFH